MLSRKSLDEKEKKDWLVSIILSSVSFLLILVTYLFPPQNPGHAGSMFAYNISFYYPLLFFSFIIGIAALSFLHSGFNANEIKGVGSKILRVALPIVLVLPMVYHATYLMLFFILI